MSSVDGSVFELRERPEFTKWFTRLRDREVRRRIAARLNLAAYGNLGDVRPVGSGISEMRIHYGAGYRIYFVQRGKRIIVLLCGGDKSKQSQDIAQAKQIADQLE